jgi:hypothetical protein
MIDLVHAIRNYAAWLYTLLALLMAREVLAMWRAGRDRDVALFGLEREAATGRAVRSLITLFLLATIAVGVYTLANVVAPVVDTPAFRRSVGGAPLIETPPTMDLPTDTPTPAPATATRPPRIVTAVPVPTEPSATPAPSASP